MADLYAAELQAVRELYRDADDSVIETIAFTRSCGKALRVESGKQALELFVARYMRASACTRESARLSG
mgnify:FL=1